MDRNVICVKEDEIVLREGDTVPYMYYVLSGAVTLYLNYHEKDEIVLGVCSEGKVFCEMGILNNSPSLYTAVAFDNETKLLKITQDNFVDFIKKYPENTIEILRNMARINGMLVKNLDLLSEEVVDSADSFKRNKDLRENIARYSVRGIETYKNMDRNITGAPQMHGRK